MASSHGTKRSERFFNRELSWLDFNHRVLEEGICKDTPTLEKVKFLSIFAANLDEFFMVRVAGLKKAFQENFKSSDSPDKLSPGEVLKTIANRTRIQIEALYDNYFNTLVPDLNKNHIKIKSYDSLSESQKLSLTEYFYTSIFPVLTPLAVDPAHPFPFLSNLRLYLLITFESTNEDQNHPPIAFVEIPEVLPRLIHLKTKKATDHEFILLEDLISQNLDTLFLGYLVKDVSPIRVTRDLDFTLLENDVVDLMKSVQREVKNREQAQAVRLEVSDNLSLNLIELLKKKLTLSDSDIYFIPGPVSLKGLIGLHDLDLPDLKHTPFNPRLPQQLKRNKEIFSLIREQDILLHHPYDSFYAVIEFLTAATHDPQVLAIKQTLYRTSGDSPIIDALIQAAEQGKQVTAVVELKARFDEKNNIIWARQMERSGVNVVYGFIGLKTHAKTTLVVRQEDDGLRRYVHLSTGNYNSSTAQSYVDLGLMTADPHLAYDISAFFNLLTGFNFFTNSTAASRWIVPEFRKLVIAPLELRERILNLIQQEINQSRKGNKAIIIAKMNALVDREIIEKLYEASQEGVKIELIVRGICCLKPQVPGMSENIRVISIVDRFLEHSRIFLFHAGGKEETYLASADWMPRNMERRVEIMFPITDQGAKDRIIQEILKTYLVDNTKAKILDSKGNYVNSKRGKNQSLERAQSKFIELARESGLKSIPYEKAIRHNLKTPGRRPLHNRGSRRSVFSKKRTPK